MSTRDSANDSDSVWFSFESRGGIQIHYLFDYVKKAQATRDDAGYELTLALKDKDFAEKHGIDQEYITRCFATYISRDLIDPFPSRIVTTIPSSNPSNFHRAIDKAAEMVNEWHDNPHRPYLKRTSEVASAHLGGSRDRGTHERTIDAPYKGWIRGRHFLIIDDVATTCSSMEVCRQKLLNAGAASVECAVFSKTFDDYRDSKSSQSFLTKRSRAKAFLSNSKLPCRRPSKLKEPHVKKRANCVPKEKPGTSGIVDLSSVHLSEATVKKGYGYCNGVILELRQVNGQTYAFLDNNRAIPVPVSWVEYVEPAIGKSVGIGYVDSKDIDGNPVSSFRYLDDFRRNLEHGDYLEHRSFGIGFVESRVSPDTILVHFSESDTKKKIMPEYAPIKPVNQLQYYQRRYEQGERKISPLKIVELSPEISWDDKLELLEQAVNEGSVDAAIKLGEDLEGRGSGSDALAAKYYKMAYDSGERFVSAFMLARYHSGSMESYLDVDERTAEPDYALAEKYYRESIEAGDRYASTNNLACLIIDKRPDEAIQLLEMAVAAGNERLAAKTLADQYAKSDKAKAEELYRTSANAGNIDAAYELAKLIAYDSPDEAIKLFERTIDSSHKAFALEWLGYLNLGKPELAKKYFAEAIEAGERYASPNYLAQLLNDEEERDERIRLLKMAVDHGNTNEPALVLGRSLQSVDEAEAVKYLKISADADNAAGCNEYALLIQESNPMSAKEYFSKAIELGDKKFAPYNLGKLLLDSDREAGIEALELASDNGNASAMNSLALAIEQSDPNRCVELLEKAVLNGELTCAPNNLAWRIKEYDRARAIELLTTCIENNGTDSAVDTLLQILLPTDIEQAIDVAEKAFDRGNISAIASLYGFNDLIPASFVSRIPLSPKADMDAISLMSLGVFWLGQHTDAARKQAIRLFEMAIEGGDTSMATCNLAMVLFRDDPERAAELYELSLEYDQTEAKLGLGWLLENSDPDRSKALLEDAYSSWNIGESLWFIAEYLRDEDPSQAIKLLNKAKDAGSLKAEYSLKKWFGE